MHSNVVWELITLHDHMYWLSWWHVLYPGTPVTFNHLLGWYAKTRQSLHQVFINTKRWYYVWVLEASGLDVIALHKVYFYISKYTSQLRWLIVRPTPSGCCAHTTVRCVQAKYVMMTSSNGNIFRVTGHLCGEFTGPGEFPTQRPMTRSFDVFFDVRLNKRLGKQWWDWWFETLSRPLWRHRNVIVMWIVRI